MKIVKLTVENFMRLVAVEITPQGNAIMITGKNGAGKSSVLESIIAVFGGKKARPAKPIREGEDHAEIVIETENFIIKTTFTAAGGGSTTVTNAEGMIATSPQGLLDKFYGKIAFRPMDFYKDSKDVKKQREQRDTLMKLVGLDFADIDQDIFGVKSDRSVVKTSKETYVFEAGQIPELPDRGHELIVMSELTEKLTAATQFNEGTAETLRRIDIKQGEIERLKEKSETNKNSIAVLKQEFTEVDKVYDGRIEALKSELNAKIDQEKKEWANRVILLKEQLANAETNQADGAKLIEEAQIKQEELATTLEPVIDVAAINQAIENAEGHNNNIRVTARRKGLLKKSAAKSREFAELGKQIKVLEAKKAERLAAVEMPIKGLSVNEETILFNDPMKPTGDIPLAQVNDSMQLQISVAISMALNPKLKVILMKGNDLDSESLETVCRMAKEKDYQVWIEKVSDDKKNKTGFIIEDGSVVAADKEDTLLEKAENIMVETVEEVMKETIADADKDELRTEPE